MPIAEIKAPDVLTVLRRVEDRGLAVKTHKAKDVLSLVFRYAVQTGRREYNPCDNLRGALKPVRAKNMAALINPEDVAGLLRAIDAYQGGPVVRAALRLAPLLFCRPGELRAMKWKDVDLEQKQWCYTVPKVQKDVIVPLSRQAMEILKDLYPLTGGSEFVLPGQRWGRPFSDMTLNRALQAMGYNTQTEHTSHGFRAMARTLLRERLNFESEVIEFQLSHRTKNPLGTAYDRALFIDQRRLMMQQWANYLDDLKAANFDKVVPFNRAASE
jgi:integrase